MALSPQDSLEWAGLPKCTLPPPEEFFPVEKFVADGILSRHASEENPALESASKAYYSILDLIKKKDDLQMMVKILLALRTSGNGSTMGKLSRENELHSRLIHYLFQFNAFQPSIVKVTKDWDEPYSLADAHLNLIVTIVSANSTYILPAMNMLWKQIEVTPPDIPNNDTTKKTDKVENNNNRNDTVTKDDIKANEEKEHNKQKNIRLHGALSRLLQLVPKGRSEIFTVIEKSFPYKSRPLEYQRDYIHQCLILLQYVPTIHQHIIEMLIDKSLEIDVEIKIANNGNVSIEEVENDDAADSADTTNLSMGALVPSEESTQERAKQLEMTAKMEEELIAEMADKLDSNMLIFFRHLESSLSPRELYNMIIPSFGSMILTTHRCKFVQFIILYLCGKDVEAKEENNNSNKNPNQMMMMEGQQQHQLYREFAGRLIEIILDHSRAPLIRQSATCYLASFVSRAVYVCAETACESISALLRFAEAYMDCFPTELSVRKIRRSINNDLRSAEKDRIDVHSLFYTVCQAAFYIMCFRGKECVEHYETAVNYYEGLGDDDASVDSGDETLLFCDPSNLNISCERWTRLCTHHLQPLRFCLESVRGEFLLLAEMYKLVDYDVLNKLIVEDRKMASGLPSRKITKRKPIVRKALAIQTPVMQMQTSLKKKRTPGGVGGLGRGLNPLDSFFPFDPYLLRNSYGFIEPFYRQWESSTVTKEEQLDGLADPAVDMDEMDVDDDDVNDDGSMQSNDEGSVTSTNHHSHHSVESHEDENSRMSLIHNTPADHDTDEVNDVPMGIYVEELKRARATSITDDFW